MSKEFNTVGEAVAYCKRFGLEISPVSDVLFETANALHSAVETGVAIGAASLTDKSVYIDGQGDRELIERLMQTAKEMGCDQSLLTINCVGGKADSNTYNPEQGK